MKKSTLILTVSLLLTLFCFCSCNKGIDEDDRKIIKEIKNSPRDPRLIGKWKILDMNLEKVNIGVHYRSDGVVERGLPVYDKNNKIAYYKSDHEEIYFHTISDNVVIYYIIKDHLLYGSYYMMESYEMIHEDTIHVDVGNAIFQSTKIRDNDIDIRN